MHQYAQDREAKFRSGVRVLLGAVVVPITWFYSAMGFFVASGDWFVARPEPLRNTVLRGISALLVAAAIALIIGLARTARWRWGVAGAWAGALTAIGGLTIVPFPGWQGTRGIGLVAVGLAVAYAWAFVRFDPPAA